MLSKRSVHTVGYDALLIYCFNQVSITYASFIMSLICTARLFTIARRAPIRGGSHTGKSELIPDVFSVENIPVAGSARGVFLYRAGPSIFTVRQAKVPVSGGFLPGMRRHSGKTMSYRLIRRMRTNYVMKTAIPYQISDLHKIMEKSAITEKMITLLLRTPLPKAKELIKNRCLPQ